MMRKLGVLMMAATMMGGSVGQSVQAATLNQGNKMELSVQNQRELKNNKAVKNGNVAGGVIEDNVKWEFDTRTGVLEITGEGRPRTCNVNGEIRAVPWSGYKDQITKVIIEESVKPVSMDSWFANCPYLTESPILPEGVESAENLFYGCTSLKEMPKLPESLQNARRMFEGCSSITKPTRLSRNLKNAVGMFQDCNLLTETPELPVGLQNASYMFEGCKSIKKTAKLPNGLKTAAYMFEGCTSLKIIKGDLPIGLEDGKGIFENIGATWREPVKIWYKATNLQKNYQGAGFATSSQMEQSCTVSFQNEGALEEVYLSYGKQLNQEEIPEAQNGYHWNTTDLKAVVEGKVTDDVIVKAQKNEYTVTFKDWDGKTLSSQKVKYEETAKAPGNPSRSGYTFTGWDKSFGKITGDLTVAAQYKKNADTNKPDGNDPSKTGGGKTQTVIKPSVNMTKTQILAGKSCQIKVTRKIKGASVSFKTSNKKVASVSKSGYVKGLKGGKALITTTVRQGGKTFNFKTSVTVKAYVKFVKVKKTIKKGKKYTFKAKAYGTGNKNLKWSVSNKKIGKISKNGKFQAKKKGKVYIIVKSGKYQKKIRVKVK